MAEVVVPVQDDLIYNALSLGSPAQVNRSAWTGKRKVIGLAGIELWSAQVTILPLPTENERAPWRAFLFALDGPVNWFKLHLPCATHAGNRPVVGSGATNGYTLPLNGMTPSQTILKAGQFMVVPLPSGYDRTVCLIADLVSDGSGNATASFRPALGEVPTSGVTAETKNPFVRMALVSASAGMTYTDGVGSASFDVEEAR